MNQPRVLITGAHGQIGSVLTKSLRRRYGADNILATDIRDIHDPEGQFAQLDALDAKRLLDLIDTYRIDVVYHLAAILSAKGEQIPQQAWQINMDSLFNVLEAAKNKQLQLFFPSSIAVFGENTPRDDTPQETIMQPSTVYGISKLAGENWCQYYYLKYGVDVRSIRYPGIIGYQSLPGGGTTDYAVDIYHKAMLAEPFTCFLAPDMKLPMMYMDDAIRATIELMEAPINQIRVRTAYNLSGMCFSPQEQAQAIRKWKPDFSISYAPDFRQQIAASWPNSIDDSVAQQDWGWKPEYNLDRMTQEMLEQLKNKYQAQKA
ncbi:MAG: NAD-dependent epimerase/dehydratase family protein [Saprospiraceae bacterium]|nr:NAD-dependent epimerase/dehydratase family protein [Saprospiraceae bacterium]